MKSKEKVYLISWTNESGDNGHYGYVVSETRPAVGQVLSEMIDTCGKDDDIEKIHTPDCNVKGSVLNKCDCPVSTLKYIFITEIPTIKLKETPTNIKWRYSTSIYNTFYDVYDVKIEE